MSSVEFKYNIANDKNYNSDIDVGKMKEFIHKYIDITHQYLLYCGENIIVQNEEYHNYVILKGLECIANIFNILLLYTKNFDLVYYHCQKAFYYYVEFIGQIGNENNSYLKLNSKDAILFVYRKTIFQINSDYRKNFTVDDEQKTFFTDLCEIIRDMNKIIEYQLINIDFENKDGKMVNIIKYNTDIMKHIYENPLLKHILVINNRIINDLSQYFSPLFIVSVLIYYNKKLYNINNRTLELETLNNYSFSYEIKYDTYTALRLTNVLTNN